MINNNSIENVENTSSILLSQPYCGDSDEVNKPIVFWIEGVLLSIVGGVGVFGNMVMLYVLSKIPSRYNIFNKLLMQLVSVNSISIILVFIDFSLRKSFKIFSLQHALYGYMWRYMLYPLIKVSFTWVMCCTMAITVERLDIIQLTVLFAASVITQLCNTLMI